MADTVVIVNEFGEIGLDHHLIKQVTDNVILLPNGCLCCTVREDVVQTLRDLHRGWLVGNIPDFGRVLVETTGLAEPSPLLASLVGHPVLADVFALRAVVTVIDAEYGLRHLEDHPTCWQQVCVADHLVISKCDLASPGEIQALHTELTNINPLAGIRRLPADNPPDFLFERTAERPARSSLACAPAEGHLAHIETVVLRSEGPVSWRKFQVWLNDLLEGFGSQVLRLKGCLRFDDRPTTTIVQAVHQTFYPLTEAPDSVDTAEGFLVLMMLGQLQADVERGFALCRAENQAGP
jgi:G3E family GTPase